VLLSGGVEYVVLTHASKNMWKILVFLGRKHFKTKLPSNR